MKNDARTIVLLAFFLLMAGIVTVYSSSAVFAYQRYGDSLFFIKRHLVFIFIGLAASVLFIRIHPRALCRYAVYLMLFSVILLVLVFLPGTGSAAGGARRWIRFFGIGFQPSEWVKIALIVYMADFTSRKRYYMSDVLRGFTPPVAVTLLTAGLILIQPDMGSAVAVVFIGFTILFCAGAELKHIAAFLFPVIPVAVMAVILRPYRLRRIITFLDPWSESSGAGFQLVQSFIALGSGGITGVGLGQSKQKLFYLPEAHTDFVFSILGEELGFLGTAGILAVYFALIIFIFRIALRLEEKFASTMVMGIGIMMSFEVIVNAGVATGVLPTKGLPLPFLSYGGSSLVCHMIGLALILNVAKRYGYDK